MPSKTAKQRRFMAAACKGRTRKKVSRKVACEFHAADKKAARRRRRR